MKRKKIFKYTDFIGFKTANEIINYLESYRVKCIGEGCSRRVYRISPNKVIKIQHDWELNQNKVEAGLSDNISHKHIAKVHWYHHKYLWIIADYATKINSKIAQKWCENNYNYFLNNFGIDDLCEFNVGRVNGKIVVIDYGWQEDILSKLEV